MANPQYIVFEVGDPDSPKEFAVRSDHILGLREHRKNVTTLAYFDHQNIWHEHVNKSVSGCARMINAVLSDSEVSA